MIIHRKLTRLFAGTLAVNAVMLIVMIPLYAEPFSLAMDPFSWLGKIVTTGGSTNTASMVLFSATLLYNAYRWRQAVSLLAQSRFGSRPLVKFLCRAVLVGFILLAFPCDRFDPVHSTGGGLAVGGLWAITTSSLYRLRDQLGAGIHLCLQLFLQVAAVFCGVSFVLDTPLKGFSQRPLLAAILAETVICLKTLSQNLKFPGLAESETKSLTLWHGGESQ